jgi:hypothetical protein
MIVFRSPFKMGVAKYHEYLFVLVFGFELLANHFSYDVIRVDSHFYAAVNRDRNASLISSYVFFFLFFHLKLQTGSWRIQDRKFTDHVEVIEFDSFHRLAVYC